ncbi:hypothetical protein C5Y96_25600 [Blastopirellula marina]|uniref:Uncharacterized protein n=1 Tax=Blastopirellula marina TaxID=124 RepID=A0A2S8EZF4_9BACT|nr:MULTISPECIES: hypothetical protein [Pirellulaceae]PQO25282.1 hypothetical protein C5Y96_25600 [Blastopirellula marina]RCS41715.1 hypothetical protein DTL36_25650 [Bremerella cremea]
MGQFLNRRGRANKKKSNSQKRHRRNRLSGFEHVEHRRMLAGTELVFDVNVTPDTIRYEGGVELDGAFYFYAESQEHKLPSGFNLWKYDPAANGGQGEAEPLNREIIGVSTQYDRDMIAFDGKIYFTGNKSDTGAGTELWSYDPASDTFTLVADVYAGNQSSYPNRLTILNDKLYFIGFDGTNDRALLQYDPSVGSITSFGHFGRDDLLWIKAIGVELWVYDPAANEGAGTLTQVDLNYSEGSLTELEELWTFGGKIYLTAFDINYGRELFVYDPNQLPVAMDDVYTAVEDTPLTIDAAVCEIALSEDSDEEQPADEMLLPLDWTW